MDSSTEQLYAILNRKWQPDDDQYVLELDGDGHFAWVGGTTTDPDTPIDYTAARPEPSIGALAGILTGDAVGAESERCGQDRQPGRGQRAQRHQHRVAVQTLAAGGDLGTAAGQLQRQQALHQSQDVVHQAHATAHPAHRSGQLDGITAQLIGDRHQTARLLGFGNHLLEFGEGARQPAPPGSRAAG